MKTNSQWYPYPEFGTFYKLENGVLIFCPMLVDGSKEKGDGGEVDFTMNPEIKDHLLQVREELQTKD